MATFKAGVIGCGGRGRSHARGYQVSPDVEIVACSDPVKMPEPLSLSSLRVPNTYETIRNVGHRIP